MHAAAAARTPPCFGAAARDPEAPCVNNALNRVAIPSPYDAPLEPSEPCERIARIVPARVRVRDAAGREVRDERSRCSATVMRRIGGRPSRTSRAGASWHGVSINRNLCPFTLARTNRHERCKGWTRGALRWLRNHPEVETLFVSANAGSGVQAGRAGRPSAETKIARLPARLEARSRSRCARSSSCATCRTAAATRRTASRARSRGIATRRGAVHVRARRRSTPDLQADAAELRSGRPRRGAST